MRKLYLSLFFLVTSAKLFSQNYTVLGNASQLPNCNCYQLTPNAGGQAGAIFQNNTINLNNSFDFTFSNFFGCNGGSGADGEAFVLTSNPNGLGNQGEGLGYGGSNQPCSFAIEYDTWQNGNHGDPSFDHTAYESGGSVDHNVAGAVSATAGNSNLDNCQWHTIRIVWDANTQTMSDYVDGSLRITQILPGFIGSFLCGNPIVNWGWTGSTGGGWNLQQVCMKSISNWVAGSNYQSCTPTIAFSDISTSNVATVQSWAWAFGDGSTSTLQNPTHTYPGTGTFVATLIIKDISGCSDTFVHPVYISPPIALASTLTNPGCNGAHTGGIVLTESGGFGASAGHGGFQYNWSDGAQGLSDAGMGAGTVTVTATDGICVTTAQYTLNQPTAVTAGTSSTAANCGQSNGTCTITITGGTPPYQNVTWAGLATTGGPNTYTTTGLLAGTYIANFNDANGCSALLQYTATVSGLPCGLTASATSTNVTCFGGNNGSATLTVTGGANPATITWTSGGITVGTGVTINNLVAGTYNYTYTDQLAGNTFTGTIVITQPGAAMVIGLATSNISCAGRTNGQAIVSVSSGGAMPFSYAWSGGQPNNPVANNLGAGAITVTVTDANGCTATATGTISSAPALQINITTVNNGCNQYNNGSATANVTGGTPPYTYYWNNISSGQTDLSLGGGNYTVTVTDSATCTITGTASISQSSPLLYTIDSTNIKCKGDSTGNITVNASGGAPPYTYTWSSDSLGNPNPALTGAALTNLKAGEYELTLTDANGCSFFTTTFLQQPATALTVVTSQRNVTCYGANNGYIVITLGGGTAPYTYQGNTVPPGTDTVKNLPPAIYTAFVQDANGCTVTAADTITSPAADSLPITHVNNVCYGAAIGSATANFVNATGAVVYNWSNAQTGPTISNLPANTYTITATDANSCSLTGSVTINQPTAISLQIAQTNVACFGGSTGNITITTTGGTGPTYNWNPNVSTTNTASALPQATYNITVTDQAGCTKDTVVVITQPQQLSATYQVTNVPCFGQSTGSISVTAAGGTPTYGYTWVPNVSTTNTASNLAIGNYAVTVTDLNGCTVDSSFTLTQPASALVLDSSHTSLSCFNSNDGVARVIATGGTNPYSYSWTGSPSTLDSANALADGTYSVVVTDANQCTASALYGISQPTQIQPVATPINELCNGQSTGSVTLATTGGVPGYTYSWNPNVSNTNAATNIPAGAYSVTVTDATGCTVTVSSTVTQPPAFSVTATATPVVCFGDANGSLTIVSAGGTFPYNYFITDGTTPQTNTTGQFNNLISSTYTIIITDQNGCPDTTTATVAHPAQLTDVLTFASPGCSYLTNGRINVVASGGNPGYTFSGTNLTTNSTGLFSGLAAGTYNITVTDSKNCTVTDVAALIEPDSIIVTVTPASGQVKLGDTLQLTATSNQTGNINYSWTPDFGLSCYNCSNPVFNGVYSQPYTVVATNDSGCVATFTFTVTVVPNYDIFIPNAFTPNGDGKNDYWQIYGNLASIKQLQVMVFDRIGEKVFESDNINFVWDGTFKGQPAPIGVYVYAIKAVWLDNRSDDAIKGSITLLK